MPPAAPRKQPKKRSAEKAPKRKAVESPETLLAKAVSHPIRAQAMYIFNQRIASASGISRAIGVELGKVSYHVKTLREYGCIEMVAEVPRRGATETFYRGVTGSFLNDENWAKLSAGAKHGISLIGLKHVTTAIKTAVEAGTFDSRDDRHLSCTPVKLDEQGWAESMSVLNETLERLLLIHGESASRLAENGDDAISAYLAMLGFELPVDAEGFPSS